MNRRNFLKATGIAIAAPALPVVAAKGFVAVPVQVKMLNEYSMSLDGLLRDVYLPSITDLVFTNTVPFSGEKIKSAFKKPNNVK